MIYAIETWMMSDLATDKNWSESPTVEIKEFTDPMEARRWAWKKLREGFLVRMWSKPNIIIPSGMEYEH